jgi:hypothetical protein
MDVRSLEQVLQELLGRKVWVLASIGNPTVPFERDRSRRCTTRNHVVEKLVSCLRAGLAAGGMSDEDEPVVEAILEDFDAWLDQAEE